MNPIQRIPLKTLFNTRDLGGIPTKDSKSVKYHRLLRSGQLYGMSTEDQQTLIEHYCLKNIIDFRTLNEQAEKPDPDIAGVTHICNPILKEMTAGITHDEQSENMTLEEATLSMGQRGIDPTIYMQAMYEEIITGDYSLSQYSRFFDILAGQKEGSSLWHCSAGKDRVGIGTAMLLYTLGVDTDIIIEDYMMTEIFLKEEVERILEQIAHKIPDPSALDAFRICMGVKEQYITRVFQMMEETCGSIDEFLLAKVGITAEKKQTLKALYLE